MKISLICPNRNNLRYFKWMYDSVRKNQGDHEVFICSAADACTDGTLKYYEELTKMDDHFSYIVNPGPERLGHTILYDQIIRDLVKTDLAMIWHCDMYLCPGALDTIAEHMFERSFDPVSLLHLTEQVGINFNLIPQYKTVVSLTRIEPPLHPPGPEKIIRDFGTEPEEFQEEKLLEWIDNTGFSEYFLFESENKLIREKGYSEGVFAPWAFWVDEFKEIGGHDPIFAPQSKEDSDIFNRFALNGTKFIQTWEGFVYHMTCRGNRFNPNETKVGINNPIWEKQNEKSSREFIRKWGHFVKHDEFMKPIIPPKYSIVFIVRNCTKILLKILEPWCSLIVTDLDKNLIDEYISEEKTSFNLKRKIYNDLQDVFFDIYDIFVDIDGNKFSQEQYNCIMDLGEIIKNSGSVGSFDLFGMYLSITNLRELQNNLIICEEKIGYFNEDMVNGNKSDRS